MFIVTSSYNFCDFPQLLILHPLWAVFLYELFDCIHLALFIQYVLRSLVSLKVLRVDGHFSHQAFASW